MSVQFHHQPQFIQIFYNSEQSGKVIYSTHYETDSEVVEVREIQRKQMSF